MLRKVSWVDQARFVIEKTLKPDYQDPYEPDLYAVQSESLTAAHALAAGSAIGSPVTKLSGSRRVRLWAIADRDSVRCFAIAVLYDGAAGFENPLDRYS